MNPFLKKLGYSSNDRVVVIHADDIGMCQATLTAYADLVEFGLVSSASTMVPCSWFPSVAEFCRTNPEADMGVHVTLTCEWDSYRWGPISTCDPASGLLDDEGYFPRSTQHVWESASANAAIAEAAAQIDKAIQAGIDATHAEDHMLALMHPRLLSGFVDLVIERRIPLRRVRVSELPPGAPGWAKWIGAGLQELERAEAAGFPLFDAGAMLPLDDPDDQVGFARQTIDRLPAGGLSFIVLHPAQDTPELRAIAPDWRSRVANYEALMSPELREYVRDAGVQLVGFRALHDQIR